MDKIMVVLSESHRGPPITEGGLCRHIVIVAQDGCGVNDSLVVNKQRWDQDIGAK